MIRKIVIVVIALVALSLEIVINMSTGYSRTPGGASLRAYGILTPVRQEASEKR